MSEAVFKGIYANLTDAIISAAVEVHKELGCGLKEEAYEAVLAWELGQRGFRVRRQVPCPVVYKGHVFCSGDEHPKRIDLLVEDKIVLELKAVPTKHPVFAMQCRTYLRMLNLPVGLVLNFGFPTLKEGLEHVSNPRASSPSLPNSEPPGSESKQTAGQIAPATGRAGDLEIGRKTLNETPPLPNSGPPGSESKQTAGQIASASGREGDWEVGRTTGKETPSLPTSEPPGSESNQTAGQVASASGREGVSEVGRKTGKETPSLPTSEPPGSESNQTAGQVASASGRDGDSEIGRTTGKESPSLPTSGPPGSESNAPQGGAP